MQHHLFVSDEIHSVDSILRDIKNDPKVEEVQRGLFSLKTTLWLKPFEEQKASDVLQPFLSILDFKDITENTIVTVFKSLHRIAHAQFCSDVKKGDFLAQNLLDILQRHLSHQNFNIYAVNTFQIIYELTLQSKISPQISVDAIKALIENFAVLKLPQILPYSFSLLAKRIALSALPLGTPLLEYLITISRYGLPVQRALCIEILGSISEAKAEGLDLIRPATSALFIESLDSPDRVYFIPMLRLFFIIFSQSWDAHLIEFGTCIDHLLNFINSKSHNADLRADAFELLADFAAIPAFIKQLYSNYNQRDSVPNLSDVFLQTVCQIAGSDSDLIVSRPLAIGVVSSVVGQLSDFRLRSQSTFFDNLDFHDENISLNNYITKVNSLIEGHETSLPPKIAAQYLLSTGINAETLGNFFSKNDNYTLNILDEFIQLLNITNLPFDSAVRVFLTIIKFPGEGQVLDRAFEHFAKVYSKHIDKEFENEAAVHILGFAWLMLHTSLHNASVTEKQTLEGFRTMLKGQNGDKNFRQEFLDSLFDGILKHPLSPETSLQKKTPEYWHLIECREKALNLRINTGFEMGVTAALFEKTWRYAGPVLSDLFASGSESGVDAFTSSVQIASTFHETHIIDNVFKTFCAFSVTSINAELSIRAVDFVLRIVNSYGSDISDWTPFLQLLAKQFAHGIISNLACAYKDIHGQFVLINPAMFTPPKETEIQFSKRQRAHSSMASPENMAMQNFRADQIAQASVSFPSTSVQYMLRDFNNACSLSRGSSDSAIAASIFLLNFGVSIIKANAFRANDIDAYKLFDTAAHIAAVATRTQVLATIICVLLPVIEVIPVKDFIKGPSLARMFSQRKFILPNIEYTYSFLTVLLEKDFAHPAMFKLITCPTPDPRIWDGFQQISQKVGKDSLEALECCAFIVAGNQVLQITEVEAILAEVRKKEKITQTFTTLINASMICNEKMKRFSLMMMGFSELEAYLNEITLEFETAWFDFLKMCIEFEFKEERLYNIIERVIFIMRENEDFVNKTNTYYATLKRELPPPESPPDNTERRNVIFYIARSIGTRL